MTDAFFSVHFHVDGAGVMFGRKNPSNLSCDERPVVG
jgi:hypothetical protein